ncbi:MAG: mechanosensitive ion channel [Thermodesulfobacteriota bacterium]|nr:mechanosensitive ion channel [Thermodesulfobacteriota bacterium]
MKSHIEIDSTMERIIFIILLAGGAHVCVFLIKKASQFFMSFSFARSYAKIKSIVGLITSFVVFIIYFGAFGFILKEFGVSITAYLASASIIGLAIAFGSQGYVQDVVTGLTLVFSNLLDVGDMVEIGGQTGIVRSISIRFTELENAMGASVYIPNRSITSVINYPRGYVRAIIDVGLLVDEKKNAELEQVVKNSVHSIAEQFPGINIGPPSIEGRIDPRQGKNYLRIKFRIWPGRGTPLETTLKQELIEKLRLIDPNYADWMVTVYYEVEKGSNVK